MKLILSMILVTLSLLNFKNTFAFDKLKEKKLGYQLTEILWKNGLIYDDIELNSFLTGIANKLTSSLEDTNTNFSFYVINDKEVNAFASWNGVIGVNTGLILFAENESELAGILAHEISHVTQNHLSRFLIKNNNEGLILAGGILASILAKDINLSNAFLSSSIAATLQNRINYTREHEWEADRFASELIQKTEFNPVGLGTFFKRMIDDNEDYEFLSTHPISLSRVADNLSRSKSKETKDIKKSQFKLIQAKLFIDIFNTKIDSNDEETNAYSETYKLFKDGKYSLAKTSSERLLKLSSSPYSMILAGRIYSKLKLNSDNFFLIAQKLGLEEEGLFFQSLALSEKGLIDQAITKLKLFIKTNNANVKLYKQLSRFYFDANQNDKGHFYNAESLVKQGRFDEAALFYQRAKNLTNDKNFFDIVAHKEKTNRNTIDILKEID